MILEVYLQGWIIFLKEDAEKGRGFVKKIQVSVTVEVALDPGKVQMKGLGCWTENTCAVRKQALRRCYGIELVLSKWFTGGEKFVTKVMCIKGKKNWLVRSDRRLCSKRRNFPTEGD